MLKPFLKQALLPKPMPMVGFGNKALNLRLPTRLNLLWSLNGDEKLEKKTLNSQQEKWFSVLDFFLKQSTWNKKQVPNSSEENDGYFLKSNQRFYVNTEQKVNLKDKISFKKADDCILYISGQPSHSIGLNLTTFRDQDSFIVCDIDHQFAGENILKWADSPLESQISSFEETFGKPLVIKTPSKGHLHLIYKNPYKIPPKTHKVKICSRLGFPIEYTFVNIELYSSNRTIIKKPASLTDLSAMPEALFPYNYFQKSGFESLTQGLPLNPNVFPKADSIPEGRRNTFLFNFFRVDNFSREIVLAANQILCDPPLPNDEVLRSCERRFSKLKYNLDKDVPENEMRKPGCFFDVNNPSFETIDAICRIREDQSLDDLYTDESSLEQTLQKFIQKPDTLRFTYFYKFNIQRVLTALASKTSVDTMLLVAYLEQKRDIFIEPESYIGKGIENFVIEYFLKYRGYKDKIMYIKKENIWYFYDDRRWVKKSESEIDSIFLNFVSLELKYGSLETRFSKTSSYKSILESKTTFQEWPQIIPVGINFENGIAVSDSDNRLKLIPHNPLLYHRSIFPCNFNPNASLTPVQMRFLLDLAADNVIGLNVIRYILFLAFVSNVNQVGIYLNSPPGGSKSTLVRLIQTIFKDSIVPLSLSEIKKGNTFQHDFAANKKGLVIAELSPNNSKNENFMQWVKGVTGGDTHVAQKKFGDFYENVSSIPLFIMTSNYTAETMPMWQDAAIRDRIIDVSMPKIKQPYQIKSLERWVVKNLESLVNWVLQLPISIVNDFTRVGALNEEFSLAKNAMKEFIKEKLVFIPNPLYQTGHGNKKEIRQQKFDYTSCFLPYNDLYTEFQTFLEENTYSDFITSQYGSTQSVTQEFTKTLQLVDPSQQNIVAERRQPKERGYYHVMLRDRLRREAKKTKYGSILSSTHIQNSPTETKITYVGKQQYSLIQIPKFEHNDQVKNLLLDDPLKYSGFCTHFEKNDIEAVLTQTAPNGNEDLKQQAYDCASLVATTSCKTLIEKNSAICALPMKSLINQNFKLENLVTATQVYQPHFEPINAKGPQLYATNNFKTYGSLSPLQLDNLAKLNYKPKELPQASISIHNPRNPSFGSNKSTHITLFYSFGQYETAIFNRYYKIVPMPDDVFVSSVDDPINNTFAPNDVDEKGFRQILRATIKTFLWETKMFPNQNSIMLTVLVKLVELDFYPTLLFHHSTWVNFLIQDFPEYKSFFLAWDKDNTEYFLKIYKDIENDIHTTPLGPVFDPSNVKDLYEATIAIIEDYRKIVLEKSKAHQDFYKDTGVPDLYEIQQAIPEEDDGTPIQLMTPELLNQNNDFDQTNTNSNVPEAEIVKDSENNVGLNNHQQFAKKTEANSQTNEIELNSTKVEFKPVQADSRSNQSKTNKDENNQKNEIQPKELAAKKEEKPDKKPKKRRGRPPGSKNKKK